MNGTFVDRQTPILASWLNDVNDHVYQNTNNYYVSEYGTVSPGGDISTPLGLAYAAAAAGGVEVDQLYRNGSVLMIRVV